MSHSSIFPYTCRNVHILCTYLIVSITFLSNHISTAPLSAVETLEEAPYLPPIGPEIVIPTGRLPEDTFNPVTFAEGYRRLPYTSFPAKGQALVDAAQYAAWSIRQQYLPLVRMNSGTLIQKFFSRQPFLNVEADWTVWSFAGPLQRYAQAQWNIISAEADRTELLVRIRGDFERFMIASARLQATEPSLMTQSAFADMDFKQSDTSLRAGLASRDEYTRAQQNYAERVVDIRTYPYRRNITEWDLLVTLEEKRAWYTLKQDIEQYVSGVFTHIPLIQYDTWMQHGLTHRPEVVRISAQIEFQADEATILAAYYWPTVHLYGSVSHVGPNRFLLKPGAQCCYPLGDLIDGGEIFEGTPGSCTQWAAGIRVDWEFDWSSSFLASQEADARRIALEWERRRLLFDLESEIGGFYDNVLIAERSVPAAQEAYASASVDLEREKVAYAAGLSTITALREKENAYHQACTRYEQARLDVANAYTIYNASCVYPGSPQILL